MIMSDKTRNVKSAIIVSGVSENEINVFYFINQNIIKICNEYVELKSINRFSLTNFKQLLSVIKNDDEFKKSIVSDKIKNFEIYL